MCLAIPGKLIEIERDSNGVRMGKANFGGIVKQVCLEYTPEVETGDYVLVHVGFALSKVNEEEAARTYKLLEEMDQLSELEVGDVAGGRRMKYLDEYRNEALAQKLVSEIRRTVTQPWVLMEVCGGQTHTIVKYGIDRLLPDEIELVHGPGCPVCVTSLEMIDKAHAIARRPDVIFCSFGDMLRVPGSGGRPARSQVARARTCASSIRRSTASRSRARIPDKKVVFFAIGFETTAPANAMAVWQAQQAGAHELLRAGVARAVPPAMAADPAVAAKPRAGIPRTGSRLHGDGLPGVRADRRPLPRADRHHRLRAGRHARRRAA